MTDCRDCGQTSLKSERRGASDASVVVSFKAANRLDARLSIILSVVSVLAMCW